MADFPQKVLQISAAFKQWLTNNYSNVNHNHDERYSLIGHTHQIVTDFQYPDFQYIATTRYGAFLTKYQTPCDGWLHATAFCGQALCLVTHQASMFIDKIRYYDGTHKYAAGDLAKVNDVIYQARKVNTGFSPVTDTTWTTWSVVPNDMPVMVHMLAGATGSSDHGGGSITIPVIANTTCMLIYFGDNITQHVKATKENSFEARIAFIPLNKNISVQLTNLGIVSDSCYYYDMFNGALSGLFEPLSAW